MRPFRSYAIGVKASSVGVGVEVATYISPLWNLRVTGNYFVYNLSFVNDGASYGGHLQLRGGEIAMDWFPWHNGFHVSPGIMVHSNNANATMSVPGGNTFTLGDESYTSDPSNPIHGTGGLQYKHNVGPMLLVGFGNVLPRSGRHFTVPVEVGAAYLGGPTVNLDINGGACESATGPNGKVYYGCGDIHLDPTFQPQLDAQQVKLQKDANAFRFFPIVSVGVAYKF